MAKYQLNTETLKNVVTIAGSIIGTKRQSLPILESVGIWSDGKKLWMSATDLETSIVAEIDGGNGAQSGKIMGCPNVKTLKEIIRTLSTESEKVSFFTKKPSDKEGKEISILTDGQFDIASEKLSSFPFISNSYIEIDIAKEKVSKRSMYASSASSPKHKQWHRKVTMTVDAKVIEHLNSRTLPFAAAGAHRPVLSACCWRMRDRKLRVVATDSYRLSEFTLRKNEYEIEGDFVETLIPTRVFTMVEEVFRLFGRPEKIEMTTLVTDEEGEKKKDCVSKARETTFKIQCSSDCTIYLWTRCVDGRFPAYEQVIPKEKDHQKTICEVTFDSRYMQQQVRRAHIFAKEYNNNVQFTVFEGAMFLNTRKTSKGKFSTSFVPKQVNADRHNTVALSSVYVDDIFTKLKGVDVTMQLFDTTLPVIIFDPSEGRDRYLHLVMPLRSEYGDNDEKPDAYVKARAYVDSKKSA